MAQQGGGGPMGAVMGIIGAAKGTGIGIAQMRRAKGIDATQSDFSVPEAYQERMKRLKMRETTAGSLPGQDLLENKIGASTAKGITAMRESGNQANFQNMIARSIQSEQDKLADIGIRAAVRKDELARETDEGIADLEGYQIQAQERKFEKEKAKLAEKQALEGAGVKNITSSGDTGAQAGSSFGGK